MEEKTRDEIIKWLRERDNRVTLAKGPVEEKIDLILDTVDYIEKGLELVLRALLENKGL